MENISKSGMIKPTKSRIRRFTFYYYLAYYPTRFKVSDEFVHRRRLIWDFKEGKNSLEVANSIKADIDLFKLKESLNEWWLCVIPASTEEKTKRRFKSFCKEFVKDLEINNGYKIISVKEDREAIHLAEDRGSGNILKSMNFKNVEGKKILLFDDVYTTGASFTLVARKLIALGATKVVGLFLGKTHWKDESEIIL